MGGLMVVGGLVAVGWGVVAGRPTGTDLPEAIPDDLAIHVQGAGTTTATLAPGRYLVVATGPDLVTTDASGPEVGVAGSPLTLPDVTVVAPDGHEVAVEPDVGSLLVQGPEGGLDAQSVGQVDLPVAGEHVLTVGEATAPVEGIGLVSLDAPADGPPSSVTFLATFGGVTMVILGVLLVALLVLR